MRRILVPLVFIMMVATMLALPAAQATGSEAPAQAGESGALFSLAPASHALYQAGPDDPIISGAASDELGNAVSGVVVDAEDPSTHAVVATDTTDASGSYGLAVPSGTYDVKAAPPPASGLTAGTYSGLDASGDVNLDILFVPADMVTFSGHLLDRDGTPIPNQTIYLKRTPFGKTATTDDQGFFALKVPPGDYSLEVINGLFTVPDNVPSSYTVARSGTVSLSGNTTMDITLSEVYVTGRVVDVTGLIPVGSAQVHLSGSTTFGDFSGNFDTYATCDSSGNYSAVIFPCSSLTIEATPPALSIYVYGKETGVSMLSDGSKNVKVPLGLVFSGFLHDRDGDAIPEQSVALKQDGFSKSDITGELGGFSIRVKSGTYTVELTNGFLTDPTNVPTTYQLTRNSTVNILIGMVMNLTIDEVYLSGQVLDSAGTPVPDVQLHLSATGGFGSYTGQFDSYATSDSGGNYSAVVLPSSAISVKATPPDTGACAYTETALSVTSNGTRDITLEDAVTFSGLLLDRDGDPIPAQTISLKQGDFVKYGGTDNAGAFSLKVPAGDHTLEVMNGFFGAPSNVPSTYQLTRSGTISLAADTSMNINLSEAYVKGQVVGPAGTSVSDVQLAMNGSGTWGDLSGQFDSRPAGDGWGNFSATVFPSAMTLQTTPPEVTGYGPAQAVDVDATGDKSFLVILNEFNDVTPPQTAGDLAVTAAYDISASLSWTAPGDNGSYGKAAVYDIRYSTSPITEANWDAAVQCTGEPAPKAAGQPEAFLVSGLSPTTGYYFALKTGDEADNWSGLSNVVQATTTEYVDLTVTSVTPENVPQFSWFVNLEITGTGFQPGATVKLMMGETALEASNVNVVSETSITCSVFILAQDPGAYDVVVTNPSGKEGRLLFGFWIGASCGHGSTTGMLMFGLSLGLLSLAGSSRLRRRRRK